MSSQDRPEIGVKCGEDIGDVERVQPWTGVKAQPVTVIREHPIEHQRVEVNVRVERAAEPLHDGDRATAPVPHAGVACAASQESKDRPHGTSHHGAAEDVIPGQPIAEPVREAQDPLAYRHPWEDVVDEMSGALGHTTPAAARAQRTALTGERDESVEPAPCAAEPGEPRPKGAAPQKLVKLPLDEAGQALPVAQVSRLRAERLEVVAHHLVENPGRGLPRLVGRRREGHAPLSAEPVPRSATPETWGCLDDQAHDHAVSEPAIGTMGGSFLEAPVDWVRRIGTTLRAYDPV